MKKSKWLWVKCEKCGSKSRVRRKYIERGTWYCMKCRGKSFKKLKKPGKLGKPPPTYSYEPDFA